jgi:DNA-binding NarL/FixJ family response regulator
MPSTSGDITPAPLCVPVIAFSSRCDEESVLAAVEAGAMGVLSKDRITPETLCSTVTAAFQSSDTRR